MAAQPNVVAQPATSSSRTIQRRVISVVAVVLALAPLLAQIEVLGIRDVGVLDMFEIFSLTSRLGVNDAGWVVVLDLFIMVYLILWVAAIVRAGLCCYKVFEGTHKGGLDPLVLDLCLALTILVCSFTVNAMVSSAASQMMDSYLGVNLGTTITVCEPTGFVWVQFVVSLALIVYVNATRLFVDKDVA